ncbi:MAG TPA: hypothetical protein VFW07_25265 [Parafilimonas sp.]|nr:hypothetical protein [Parafilimonas sp.]
MPKLDGDFKNQIKSLSKAELENIVIRFASKYKEVHDFLAVNYFDKRFGEEDLFIETRNDVQLLFKKNYKGYSPQLQLANMIGSCVKRINEFDKLCKNKNLCADLLMIILDEVFSYTTDLFGTCFTKYDYKVALLLKRLITLVTTRLHPDYKIEYEGKINHYLEALHRTSNHIDFIYAMPAAI